MATAVGLDAPSSCAAVRARVGRFEEVSFHDRAGQPVIAAPAREAVDNQQGHRRMFPLLSRAVAECVETGGLGAAVSAGRVPLLVSVGEPTRPDYPPDLPKRLLAHVQESLGATFSPASQVVCGGATGFFRLLAQASEDFADADSDGCIVAAVDSMINAAALDWLEAAQRLKTAVDSDGVIAGEAAAAVWVTRARRDDQGPARTGTVRALLDVAGLGFAEKKTVEQEDQPNLAEGLADAMRRALDDAGLSLPKIDFRVGGMTGERTAFMEASTALARVQRVHKDTFALLVPAEKLGDVGAALAGCRIVLTAIGMTKGYAPGGSALLYIAATGSERAACVVVAPPRDRHGQ